MQQPEWLFTFENSGRWGERKPLSRLFEYGAAEFGSRPAIADGQLNYSYNELEMGARRIAALLNKSGVRNGSRVAVLATKRACIPMFAVAIWKLGGIYIPLDAQNPAARIERLLNQLQPAAILGEGTDVARGPEGVPAITSGQLLECAKDESAPAWNDCAAPDESKPAYIIFTSGSTGVPKGVMISHGSLLDYFYNHNQVLRFTSDSHVLSFAPFHFDVSIEDTLLPLSLGAFVYQYKGMPIGLLVRRVLKQHKITHIIAVSTILTVITEGDSPVNSEVLPHLQMVMTGAELCDPKVINTWKKNFPGARVINVYGPTEATIVCTAFVIEQPEENRSKAYPIGKPLDGVLLKIMGEEGEITAPGRDGELWVGGPQVMIGYFNEPEETAKSIVTCDGVRYYKTGDICRLDQNGDVEFVGRRDDEIKLAGRRINLREISQLALAYGSRAFAGVLSSNGKRQLALVLVSDHGVKVLDAVRQHLSEQLPEYMRPQVLGYVEQPVFASTGKTNESQLLSLLNTAYQIQPFEKYIFNSDCIFAPHQI
jgi:D-alanine--poly(phosphoribitol) ligase subunit 1